MSKDIEQLVEEVIEAKIDVRKAHDAEKEKIQDMIELLMQLQWNDCFTVNLEKVARRATGMSPFMLRDRINSSDKQKR